MVLEVMRSHLVRENWRKTLDAVKAGTDVYIEKYGEGVAVIIPAEDYEEVKGPLTEVRSARRAYAAYEALKQDPSLALDLDEVERLLDLD